MTATKTDKAQKARRPEKTIVVKIGSTTLTTERGTFRLAPMANLVSEVCELQAAGHLTAGDG